MVGNRGIAVVDIEDIISVIEAAFTICLMRNDGSEKIESGMGQVREKVVLRKGYGYGLGDMVWGKVESHPWWPGQIFDEAFASSSVSETKRAGRLLVSFFGDDTFGWFSPNELVPFDPNFVEKSRQTNAKSFLHAVDHAKCEITRRAALGLFCCCQNALNFRPTGIRGCFVVKVDECEPDAVCTRKQIELARNGFQPIKMLCFLQGLALKPCGNAQHGVDWIKNVAIILAYRKVVFKNPKQSLTQEFGIGAKPGEYSAESLDLQEKVPCRVSVSLSDPLEMHSSINTTKSSSRPIDVERETYSNKRDISRLHYPEEVKSVLRPSMNEKKAALAAGALGNSMIFKSLLQKDAICPLNNEAEEATTRNRKSELENISSTNSKLDRKWKPQSRLTKVAENRHLGSSDFVVNTSSLPAVAFGGQALSSNESRVKKRMLSQCYEEDLPPEKVIIVDKRTTKEEIELKKGPQSPYKCLVSERKEASPCNQGGKPSQIVSVCAKDLLLHQQGEGSEAHCTSYKELPPTLKPPKKRLKLIDYAMIGEENNNSCSKEDMMKEQKKPRKLNSLSLERRALKHNQLNYQVNDKKDRDLPPLSKLTKHIIKKKPESRINAAQPAKLVLQFTPESALPSVPELKARFARFGPFCSAPCVSWKSSTCQSVFKWRHDAQAAYKYAVQTKSLFGNASITLELEAPKPGKRFDDPLQLMQVESCDSTELRPIPSRQKNLDSSISRDSRLKSCLKHIPGENRLIVVPQPLHPSHPFPQKNPLIAKNMELGQFVEECNARRQMIQIEARNNCSTTNSTTHNVDVSGQMLGLLTRCSEIVSNLKCQLGYVPIHL